MEPKWKKQKTTTKNEQSECHSPPAVDRLSSLPDAILIEILSPLSTVTAVSTSVLSTRWRLLWSHLTTLHLDSRHFPQLTATVVDKLLTRLVSPILLTFSIHVPRSLPHYFEPWFRHLCSRNVREINVGIEDVDLGATSPFVLPPFILQARSLVCLSLEPYCRYDDLLDDDIVTGFNLPNLRKLVLNLLDSQCGFVAKLVRGCPTLEDLSLRANSCWGNGGRNDDAIGVIVGLSCPSLKRLQLFLMDVENCKVVIDAPELHWFSLFAICSNCSFVKRPTALHEATIVSIAETLVSSILPAILNVRVLHIFGDPFGMFEGFRDDRGNALVCPNLTELKLELFGRTLDNLDSFPFESTSSNLLRHVKKIHVLAYKVEHRENWKELMEYLLRNSPALEMLDIVINSNPKQPEYVSLCMFDETAFCIDLHILSREYSHCFIEFHGQYAKLPANNEELMEMKKQLLGLYCLLMDLPPKLDCDISPS